LCCRESPAKRLRLHVVGTDALAVELDDRDQLAVARLQLRVAVDGDVPRLEPELLPEGCKLRLCALAKVAPSGLVEDNLGRRRWLGTFHLVTDWSVSGLSGYG
jgi:hypothetical protein